LTIPYSLSSVHHFQGIFLLNFKHHFSQALSSLNFKSTALQQSPFNMHPNTIAAILAFTAGMTANAAPTRRPGPEDVELGIPTL